MGDTANPRIWVNATAWVGPTNATAPTDTSTAMGTVDTDWKGLGLTSEDGMTESREQEATDHYAHGGILVRTTRSKHKRTLQVIALEDNPIVYDLVNPGSSAVDDGTTATRVVVVPNQPNPKSFALDLVDGDVVKRRYIPRGEVTEVGDYAITDSEIAAYELTITIYPTTVDTTADVLYVDLTNDPQAISA
jgi:hypothetical protein